MPVKALQEDLTIKAGDDFDQVSMQLFNSVMQIKIQNQDRQLDKIENRLSILESQLAKAQNTYISATAFEDFQYREINEKRNFKIYFSPSKLESLTEDLVKCPNVQSQVQASAQVIGEIRELLETVPKQKNNYRRQLLLLFHQAVKRNYSKKLFNKEQKKFFSTIARICKKEFVTKEEYYKFDEMSYNNQLDVLPAWE